jgi:hypothetical protein
MSARRKYNREQMVKILELLVMLASESRPSISMKMQSPTYKER